MKKVIFTNKSDVRLGFEIECVLRDAWSHSTTGWGFQRNVVWTSFKNVIKALKHNVQIGSDGSIRCGRMDMTIELRTQPLPPKDAMTLLATIFDIVNRHGYTNKTCGFHVNISSAHKSKMKNFNPLPFLSSRLWEEILTEFSRKSNRYCQPVITKQVRKLPMIHQMNRILERSDSKYRCVNLIHFGNGTSKSSRIECRGMGNVDYSKKFNVIAEYIKRIEKLFRLSCDSFSKLKVPNV